MNPFKKCPEWEWWASEVLHEMFMYDWRYEAKILAIYGDMVRADESTLQQPILN